MPLSEPQDARIATFLSLWFTPTLLLGIGGLLLLIGGVGTSIGFLWRRPVASNKDEPLGAGGACPR